MVNEAMFSATLSKSPCNLYLLWTEYEFGIGGRLPAKDFNHKQRGKVKYKYYRQKVFWDTVIRLVNSGLLVEQYMVRKKVLQTF